MLSYFFRLKRKKRGLANEDFTIAGEINALLQISSNKIICEKRINN